MPRANFSGRIYFTFEQTQNAIRANNINEWLDAGQRVFGDDGPLVEGVWHEIDEAVQPYANGILVRAKDGKMRTIYSYDGTPEAAEKHPPIKKEAP